MRRGTQNLCILLAFLLAASLTGCGKGREDSSDKGRNIIFFM